MSEKLIRVDMKDQSVEITDFPEAWQLLGGRALSSRIVREECDPSCDPLGPDNVLVLAPGTLAGTAAPTSGRISVGAKSPLTGGIKEANSGGNPGQHLAKLGYRAIVVKGKPADPDKRYGLEVDGSGARIVERSDLKGIWNYATCDALAETYGKTASFITIGPAGEQCLSGASVATTDADNCNPARHAARGGLGAVMGAKGLKFVSVDPGRAGVRKPADPKGFSAVVKGLAKTSLEGEQAFKHGTSTIVPTANAMNTFPHKNFREGQSPHVADLDGAKIVANFEKRGGGMHNCLTGCIIKCSNIVNDAEGEYVTSGLEFETMTLLGSNIDMTSYEQVAVLDRLCDDVGLDTIETGAAIGVLMDAGRLEWGDFEGVRALFQEIADGTELGRAIGAGAAAVGRLTGHDRVPVAKGQAFPAWDARIMRGGGVTYASSAMGADHTAGLVGAFGLSDEDTARASRHEQMLMALVDSTGFCMFIKPSPDETREFFGAFFGREVSREEIGQYAWQVLLDEWAFNEAAGFKPEDDVLPAIACEEPLGPQGAIFDISAEAIAFVKTWEELGDDFFSRTGVA
ncbi:MAG: aldehyde ferredoxin oxidoreductase [Deltaproteobacteria bacterium]|nr:aldehyde ferredoxin oxidoreductase [Deltaproteobacteria bacterium]